MCIGLGGMIIKALLNIKRIVFNDKKQDSLHMILCNIMQEIIIVLPILTKFLKLFSLPISKPTPFVSAFGVI